MAFTSFVRYMILKLVMRASLDTVSGHDTTFRVGKIPENKEIRTAVTHMSTCV